MLKKDNSYQTLRGGGGGLKFSRFIKMHAFFPLVQRLNVYFSNRFTSLSILGKVKNDTSLGFEKFPTLLKIRKPPVLI